MTSPTPTATAPVTLGLHHVTAVAGDPRRNVAFHTRILGQRLVKKTVNFDDPGTYHLYYADAAGTPGSVMTYFPWAGVPAGVAGSGETAATTYVAPPGTLGYWRDRLRAAGVETRELTRFGAPGLAFGTSEALAMEVVEASAREAGDFADRFHANPLSDVPADKALRAFHGVTLLSRRPAETARVLTTLFGYRQVATEGSRERFAPTGGGPGHVDVVDGTGIRGASFGVGSVHHVAFRSADADHLKFIETASRAGLRITPPQERVYFKSLYFREPGGVLFEIATDGPGFTVDEPLTALGTSLKLPPWLEPHRADLEKALPPLD